MESYRIIVAALFFCAACFYAGAQWGLNLGGVGKYAAPSGYAMASVHIIIGVAVLMVRF